MRWAGVAATLSCAIASGSLPARAQETTSDQVVDVAIAASDAEAPQMQSVVEELLARLSMTVNVTRVERVDAAEVVNPHAGPPRLARVWLDLTRPDRATLYLVSSDWQRILVRHLPKVAGHDELAREQLGHIVETAIDALAHGASLGVTREDASRELGIVPARPPSLVPAPPSPRVDRAVSPPPSPASPAPALRLEPGLIYDAQLFAGGPNVAHGPALSLFVGSSGAGVRFGGWLTAQYRLPLEQDGMPLGMRIESGSLRLLASIDVPVRDVLIWRFAAGGGADYVHVVPVAVPGAAAATNDLPDQVIFVARAVVASRVALGSSVALLAGLSCDFDPNETRYLVAHGSSPEVVLQPWPVRPSVFAGLTLR
jgi:hypothetical protein